MVHFIGAGPGAPDLITVRGQKLLGEADIIIYAGSLVNPALLDLKKEGCVVYNSATMTLEQVIDVMKEAESKGQTVARLHTGDPCLYGAIREQIDALDALGIAHDDCPGVSSFCGAAAALEMEYTLPDISQSVVITRMAGRTPVPERESIASFAAHQATMVVFLSTGLLEELYRELIAGGRYSGSDRLQSNLAGGEDVRLHRWNTCRDGEKEPDHQDSADDHRKCRFPGKLPQK